MTKKMSQASLKRAARTAAFKAFRSDGNELRALDDFNKYIAASAKEVTGDMQKVFQAETAETLKRLQDAGVTQDRRDQFTAQMAGIWESQKNNFGKSYKKDILPQMQETLRNGIREGKPSKEIQAEMERVTGKADHTIRTLVSTHRRAFTRASTFYQAQASGVTQFQYEGPRAGSRPFCAARVGKIYTIEEIEKMSNDHGLPALYFCGGYNCKHNWIPVLSDEAPIEAKDDEGNDINIPGKLFKELQVPKRQSGGITKSDKGFNYTAETANVPNVRLRGTTLGADTVGLERLRELGVAMRRAQSAFDPVNLGPLTLRAMASNSGSMVFSARGVNPEAHEIEVSRNFLDAYDEEQLGQGINTRATMVASAKSIILKGKLPGQENISSVDGLWGDDNIELKLITSRHVVSKVLQKIDEANLQYTRDQYLTQNDRILICQVVEMPTQVVSIRFTKLTDRLKSNGNLNFGRLVLIAPYQGKFQFKEITF